jgi:xanthine dehydrogenase small subunit
MAEGIRFLLGNEHRELRDIDPTMTVLNYLRLVERRCGTKEGCAEGDCGACTVVLGEPAGGRIRYRAVNACIQFLPTLDGKQLITVEQLRDDDGRLHPVQQAMVDAHGSQCGFCTPGFVMSLFALFHERTRPDRGQINDALAGNLCRCTGYGPIVTAAENMYGSPRRDQFTAAQAATLAALGRLQDGETATVSGDSRRFFAPTRLDELARLVGERPTATLLAGGTDVGLWVTKQHRPLDPVIYIGNVVELQRIDITAANIEIGAAVTYADLYELIDRHYPDFGELVRRLGSTQIRNAGTMGGNVANGSPIGDSPPPLIALGATLVLRSAAGRREMPLEDYFIAYGKQTACRCRCSACRCRDPAGSSAATRSRSVSIRTSRPRSAPSTSSSPTASSRTSVLRSAAWHRRRSAPWPAKPRSKGSRGRARPSPRGNLRSAGTTRPSRTCGLQRRIAASRPRNSC